MLVSLKELLPDAAGAERALAGFNVFGYEDARAVLDAAESLKAPVILMANKDMVRHMPPRIFGPLLVTLAEEAAVPVCVHLDHTYDYKTIVRALKAGFSSVMFDGSQLPLEENIRLTRGVVEMAAAVGASVEGEIGSVPYDVEGSPIKSILTEPEEARRFAEESGVDAVAVAVGTIHKQVGVQSRIDFSRLEAIQGLVETPLVIHGSTGIPDEQMKLLVRTRVSKLNIGTALRLAFGGSLRRQMEGDPALFDRIEMFGPAMEAVRQEARGKLRLLGW